MDVADTDELTVAGHQRGCDHGASSRMAGVGRENPDHLYRPSAPGGKAPGHGAACRQGPALVELFAGNMAGIGPERPLARAGGATGQGTSMPLLSLSQLRPGMALAADAESPDGNHRLTAGLPLTEKHLRLLRSWHLREVEVAPLDAGEGDAPASDQAGDARQTVLHRFAHLPAEAPAVAALRELALTRAATFTMPKACRPARRLSGTPANVPAPEKILTGDPVPRLPARSLHAHPRGS